MDAQLAGLLDLNRIIVILEVALALGTVIFVHELGHFALAKLCGVKVEKFYLGFDIFGWKLLKFRAGETEYGIGALPLGGYVKMLGQDDNPGNYGEEVARSQAGGGEATTAAAAEQPTQLDQRSYLAKSVPQRMSIISAGVIMNLIFAFIFAGAAYYLGVEVTPCIVNELMPGEAAWRAGVQPGDRIARLGRIENPKFTDLQTRVMLGNLAEGVPVEIERPGVEGRISMTLYPERGNRLHPMIGILGPRTPRLHSEQATVPGTAASRAEPALAPGDEIVAIDGEPIENYSQIEAVLASRPDETLSLSIRRSAEPSQGQSADGATKTLEVKLPPNPQVDLGLVMTMAPISAVQIGSPAEEAGVLPGDTILRVAGEPAGDPMTLPARVRKLGSGPISLAVSRPGESAERELTLTPRPAPWFESPKMEGQPLTLPELGLAYGVWPRVTAVTAGGPAEGQPVAAGDEVVAAKLILGTWSAAGKEESGEPKSIDIGFSADAPNWPYFEQMLCQNAPEGSRVELTLKSEKTVVIAPRPSTEWHLGDRGLITGELSTLLKANTLGEAWTLSRRQVVDSVLQVYLVIQNILRQQISPKMLGGPVKIAAAAGYSAYKGVSELLLFLTMLSANLAVVNFLPIPMLDGGHMVFLAWEGIRGKPASERVIVAFHYAGLCLLLSLMLWVLFQDVQWLGRWMSG